MDSGKYPSVKSGLLLEFGDWEKLISDHGLTLIDIISLSRDNNAAAKLSLKLGRSVDECLRYIHSVINSMKTSIESLKLTIFQETIDSISTGLPTLDELLQGGLRTGSITEVFGASGCGKSQFLLQIALEAQKLNLKTKDGGRSIIISTESALETRRLHDMSVSRDLPNALELVSYIYCHDVESQDHIIFTQLPAKLQSAPEGTIKVVLIDSISHHFRGDDSYINALEYLRTFLLQQEEKLSDVSVYLSLKSSFDRMTHQFFKGNNAFRNRISKKYYLLTLYVHLANIAKIHNVAIVVSNQVSDAFDNADLVDSDVSAEELHYVLNFHSQVGSFSGWDAQSMQKPEADSKKDVQPFNSQGLEPGHSYKKRRLQEDLSAAWHEPISSESYQSQLHPKKKIPALGYTWSKLVTTKILLWKSYIPRIQIVHPSQMQGEGGDSGQIMGSRQNEPSFTVESWEVKRFARAISDSNRWNLSNAKNSVVFTISSGGLTETP